MNSPIISTPPMSLNKPALGSLGNDNNSISSQKRGNRDDGGEDILESTQAEYEAELKRLKSKWSNIIAEAQQEVRIAYNAAYI